MESRGRKRKVSGTILAGTFTVPAAMSAVQQNAVNANLFTESTDSVSDFFAERSLKNFLKVTTYAILPAVIVALLGGLALYKLYKYFTSTKTSSTKTSTESDYWKVLNSEKKLNFSENQTKLLEFLKKYGDKLGIVGTKIEVDSKVLVEVLNKASREKERVKDLLNKKEKITVCINDVSVNGYLWLSIIDEACKEYTKYFANNINGVVNFFNKIFEQSSGGDIKLVQDEKRENILLKVKKSEKEEIEININNYSEEKLQAKVKEIDKLLHNLALVKAFAEDDEIFKYDKVNEDIIGRVLLNVGLGGKKFKAKVEDLKKVLEGKEELEEGAVCRDPNPLGHFIRTCNEKNIRDYEYLECKIEIYFDSGNGYCIGFSIEGIKSDEEGKGETPVWYTTKPLCNDTNALIEFFNMIFEANKDENGDYCKIVKKEENGEISSIDLCSYNEKGNLIKPDIRIYPEEENDIGGNNNDNINNDSNSGGSGSDD